MLLVDITSSISSLAFIKLFIVMMLIRLKRYCRKSMVVEKELGNALLFHCVFGRSWLLTQRLEVFPLTFVWIYQFSYKNHDLASMSGQNNEWFWYIVENAYSALASGKFAFMMTLWVTAFQAPVEVNQIQFQKYQKIWRQKLYQSQLPANFNSYVLEILQKTQLGNPQK